jgi:hypothetical protein
MRNAFDQNCKSLNRCNYETDASISQNKLAAGSNALYNFLQGNAAGKRAGHGFRICCK